MTTQSNRMKFRLIKKLIELIENCEKNYKQTCSKQKIANVSSVSEWVSQNRYQLPGEKNWKHEIEAKCGRPVQDGVQTVKLPGI